MKHVLVLTSVLLGVSALRAEVTGCYVEARTCDVYTGPCFANADTGLSGRHAVMAWKVDRGELNGTAVDGLSIVAVVSARDTLGLKQVLPGRTVLIVDEKASEAQRAALVAFARRQGGDLLSNVIDVRVAPIMIDICPCKGESCAKVSAGDARLETRCLDAQHDKACGNETAYYPPLASGVKARPALAVDHAFSGKGLNETWRDTERRGAYIGVFNAR